MGRVSSGAGSKQDYATPQELIASVEKRFGSIVFDLAASPENKKHKRYFAAKVIEEVVLGLDGKPARGPKGKIQYQYRQNIDPEAEALDALVQSWHQISGLNDNGHAGILWLNPPFKRIEPWVAKCLEEGRLGASITFLVPAAVGSDWFARYVWKKGDIYYLNGRVSFSEDPYTKDCMVVHFHKAMAGVEHVWDWRGNILVGEEERVAA